MALQHVEAPGNILIPYKVQIGMYSAIVRTLLGSSDLVAGTNVLAMPPITADEIWVYTNIAFMYLGTVAGVELRVQIVTDAIVYTLFAQMPPVSGVHYDRQGQWVLAAADYLRLVVYGATLHDDAYIYAQGYKVVLT